MTQLTIFVRYESNFVALRQITNKNTLARSQELLIRLSWKCFQKYSNQNSQCHLKYRWSYQLLRSILLLDQPWPKSFPYKCFCSKGSLLVKFTSCSKFYTFLFPFPSFMDVSLVSNFYNRFWLFYFIHYKVNNGELT